MLRSTSKEKCAQKKLDMMVWQRKSKRKSASYNVKEKKTEEENVCCVSLQQQRKY